MVSTTQEKVVGQHNGSRHLSRCGSGVGGTGGAANTAHGASRNDSRCSRKKALSFRSSGGVQRQHSLVVKRDPGEDLALVNESIARLVDQVKKINKLNFMSYLVEMFLLVAHSILKFGKRPFKKGIHLNSRQ